MSIIYLASPYTHEDNEVMLSRFEAAVDYVHQSLTDFPFYTIYSPVVHYHPLAERHLLPRDYEFWNKRNTDVICVAKELWVLALDGWKDSVGIKAEVEYAESLGIPISYIYETTKELVNGQ